MLRKLVLPLDGSHASEAALPFVRLLHRAFDCDVVLLRVVETGNEPGLRFSGSVEWRFREAEARDYLATVRERLAEWGIEAETVVSSGHPAREILRTASSEEADLVVMTVSGDGGGGISGMGGTAHQLIAGADVSVLLVRPASRGNVESGDGIVERILVPVDGSSRGDWALSLGASLAEANGADLELLHVVQRPASASFSSGNRENRAADAWVELQRENSESELEKRRRMLSARFAPVRAAVVVAASVPRAIAATASEGPASLLVLSAHGQSGASGWPYGSTVSSLLAHGRTSTLVFQDLPRRSQRSPRAGGWATRQRVVTSRPPA